MLLLYVWLLTFSIHHIFLSLFTHTHTHTHTHLLWRRWSWMRSCMNRAVSRTLREFTVNERVNVSERLWTLEQLVVSENKFTSRRRMLLSFTSTSCPQTHISMLANQQHLLSPDSEVCLTNSVHVTITAHTHTHTHTQCLQWWTHWSFPPSHLKVTVCKKARRTTHSSAAQRWTKRVSTTGLSALQQTTNMTKTNHRHPLSTPQQTRSWTLTSDHSGKTWFPCARIRSTWPTETPLC